MPHHVDRAQVDASLRQRREREHQIAGRTTSSCRQLADQQGVTMAENKTRPTTSSVGSYIEAIGDETRRKDCRALAKLMAGATKHKPVMRGTSIVGFGSYHYKYD